MTGTDILTKDTTLFRHCRGRTIIGHRQTTNLVLNSTRLSTPSRTA